MAAVAHFSFGLAALKLRFRILGATVPRKPFQERYFLGGLLSTGTNARSTAEQFVIIQTFTTFKRQCDTTITLPAFMVAINREKFFLVILIFSYVIHSFYAVIKRNPHHPCYPE